MATEKRRPDESGWRPARIRATVAMEKPRGNAGVSFKMLADVRARNVPLSKYGSSAISLPMRRDVLGK
jgi:hypothetical protein